MLGVNLSSAVASTREVEGQLCKGMPKLSFVRAHRKKLLVELFVQLKRKRPLAIPDVTLSTLIGTIGDPLDSHHCIFNLVFKDHRFGIP